MRGTWKKAIASVAALPMLVTLLPATTALAAEDAAGSTAASSAPAQRRKAAKADAAGDLLASFDFNDLKAGATGEIADATGTATATIHGSAAVGSNPGNGTAAAHLGSGFWLSLARTDGSALLKGRSAITLTYDSKATQNSEGWTFYAAPNADAPQYQSEHYVGVMDQTGSVTMQKYNNDGSGRNDSGTVTATTGSDWKHVSLVITDETSELYIDGERQATATPDAGRTLTDILGAEGGILQIGKANWVNGEYFTGQLDNLRIYGSALDQDAIAEDYEASTVQASDEEKVKADADALTVNNGASDVYSSITLPTAGRSGSSIAWSADRDGIITVGEKGGIAPGVVTRPSKDTKVTLTATVTSGKATTTRTFPLTVKAAVAAPKTTDYLFAHFTGTEGAATDEQMYFATSEDGLTWHDTRNAGDPVLSWTGSSTGNSRGRDDGVRDPYLVRSPEGDTVYLIATELSIYHRGGWGNADATNSGSTNLIVWESHDFVHWSEPRAVDVASRIPGAGMAWAPEAYWDDANQRYMVYWATASDTDNESGDRTNMYYSTTRDFVTFTEPVKWIDRSKSVIDTTMIRADDGWYYRVSGDTYLGVERSKDPYATTLTTGNDPSNGYYNTGDDEDQWTYVGQFKDLVGNDKWTGSKLEGPELFRYNDDDVQTTDAGRRMVYGLMWDQYAEGKGYLPFRSADLGSTDPADWAAATDVNFGALKKRHGTILPITAQERQAILAAFDKNRPVDPVTPDEPGSDPIAAYDFSDGTATDTTGNGNDLTLHNGAKVEEYGDNPNGKGDRALSIRGGTQYAEFPKGLFDGRNELTIEFSAKSRQSSGNFFSLTFGQDSNRYFFTRLRGDSAYMAITKASYGSETGVTASVGTDAWHRYAITLTPDSMAVYVDGTPAGRNDTMGATVADLGTDLLGYIGRSFYAPDAYWDGAIDDLRIYNYAKSDLEIQGPGAALAVKDTDQILSQNAATDPKTGAVTKTIVLDYWSDPKTGALSDRSKVSFDYEIPDGVTVADARTGAALTAADLDARTDYSEPLELKVTYDGETVDYTVGVEVLVTPVRISGDQAEAEGIGAKDPTGNVGWRFFADPQVVAWGGKYYIFPTTDGYANWGGHAIHAFESSDLVTWEDKGVVVDLAKDHDSMPDGRTEKAWAPGFAYRDGKFYLYFSGNGMVNVAISDPAKGGTITSGYEIQKVKVESSIDPAIFNDPAEPDRWYMAWGQSPGKYAELKDDMTGIKDGTTVTFNATRNMREGSYITARKDPADTTGRTWIYYYSYSIDDTNEPTYRVAYAWAKGEKLSDITAGDWQYGKEILSKDDSKGILGTAHHSILQVPGTDDWYVVYHCFLTDEMRPRGYDSTHGNAQIRTGNKREVRIARMTYGEDGQIDVVPVTYEGVPPETTPVVSVTGAAEDGDTAVGTTLTASFNDGWKGVKYQWLRDGKAIDGATEATYTLADADAEATVTVRAVGESTTGVRQNAQADDTDAPLSRTDELVSADAVTVKPAPEPEPGPGPSPSADASLASLTVAGQAVDLEAAASEDGATVTVDDPAAVGAESVEAVTADGAATAKVAVSEDGTVTVTVTAEDGETVKVYTVHLEKAAEPTPGEEPATEDQREPLRGAIASAKPDSEASRYTAESWEAYQKALSAAQKTVDDPEATADDVSKALAALRAAEEGLKPVSTGEGTDPGEGSGSGAGTGTGTGAGSGTGAGTGTGSGTGSDAGQGAGDADRPKAPTLTSTGADVSALALVAAALLAAGVGLALRRRRA